MKELITYILVLVSGFGISQSDWTIIIENQEKINTPYNEFSPVPFRNNFLFVASHNTGKKIDKKNNASYFDIKLSATSLNGRMLGSAMLPNTINTDLHEGPASYLHEKNILIFTKSNDEADIDGQIKLKLFQARNIDNEWQEPEPLNISQDNGNYCHPSLDQKGSKMIYASDKDNANSKLDLFLSYKLNLGWSDGIRLDSIINTTGNDCFPFIHPKGYLIFASDGHTEDQGYDLFISKIIGDSLSPPKLLPAPLNSNYDDFGMYLSKDGTNGYVSSNRPGGKGKDDIYSFSITKSLIDIIYPSVVKAPKAKQTNVAVKTDKQEEENTVKNNGISTKLGDISVLDNIYYDLNSHKIKSGEAQGLDTLITLMQLNPKLKVQLSSHTDSRGSESFNQELSDKRAISARNYLINRGIESYRVSALGFGESRIRNHCVEGADCTEEEHRFNRRTEVKILDN